MRVGFIGFGQIAHGHSGSGLLPLCHLDAYKKLAARAHVVAVADPDPVALEFATGMLPGIQVYTNHLDMLAQQKLDLVSICSPDALHARHLIDAASADVSGIWCEKPVVTVASDLEVLEGLSETFPPVQLNFWRRFIPQVATLRAQIEAGEFGKVNCVTGYFPGDWVHNGSHLVDLMTYLTGDLGVHCRGHTVGSGSITQVVGCADGGFGWSATSVPRNRYNLFELDILCQTARIRVTRNGRRLEISRDEQDAEFQHLRILQSNSEHVMCDWKSSFVLALSNLIDCVEAKTRCTQSSFVSALRVGRLVAAAQTNYISF